MSSSLIFYDTDQRLKVYGIVFLSVLVEFVQTGRILEWMNALRQGRVFVHLNYGKLSVKEM